MRILIVNTLYYPDKIGGAEVSVQLLAETLVEQGHDVSVVCIARGRVPRKESVNGVHVYRIRLFNVYWPFDGRDKGRLSRIAWHGIEVFNPVMIARLSAIVREVDPDVVHTNNVHGFSTAIWGWLARRRLPIVHTIRDYALLCSRGSLYRSGRRCESQCADCRVFCTRKRIDSRHVSTVVGISRHVLVEHLRHDCFAGRRNDAVVYNSVPALPPDEDRGIRDARTAIVFGYIGRLVPEKGVLELLQAFNRLRARHGDVRLLVAGSGPDGFVADLTRHAGPEVTMLGQVDAAMLYRSADVIVVPSLWDEPFGRTVAEALVFGRPVVCSNRGALAELVAGRRDCRVFDADRDDALFDTLEQLVSERRAAVSVDRGPTRESVESLFDPQAIAARYVELYRDAIESHVLVAESA
ncbi:glycosyltransferase [Burkholderia sp. Bp9012]|uniref:glycosyltransferase family 4 protein n=1 Tax=Burkholderia sp. Bp9012 TaxID=2184562 RepID=UPI000F5AA153|nr:glycosyltransferase family 4 protein [Burkholderia sp. Bp9012]RQR70313.1 glycosyltransferase [Burkholderia sp. Bp9012]